MLLLNQHIKHVRKFSCQMALRLKNIARSRIPNRLLILCLLLFFLERGNNHYPQEAYAEWHGSLNAKNESELAWRPELIGLLWQKLRDRVDCQM